MHFLDGGAAFEHSWIVGKGNRVLERAIRHKLATKRRQGHRDHLEYFLSFIDGMAGNERRKEWLGRAVRYQLRYFPRGAPASQMRPRGRSHLDPEHFQQDPVEVAALQAARELGHLHAQMEDLIVRSGPTGGGPSYFRGGVWQPLSGTSPEWVEAVSAGLVQRRGSAWRSAIPLMDEFVQISEFPRFRERFNAAHRESHDYFAVARVLEISLALLDIAAMLAPLVSGPRAVAGGAGRGAGRSAVRASVLRVALTRIRGRLRQFLEGIPRVRVGYQPSGVPTRVFETVADAESYWTEVLETHGRMRLDFEPAFANPSVAEAFWTARRRTAQAVEARLAGPLRRYGPVAAERSLRTQLRARWHRQGVRLVKAVPNRPTAALRAMGSIDIEDVLRQPGAKGLFTESRVLAGRTLDDVAKLIGYNPELLHQTDGATFLILDRLPEVDEFVLVHPSGSTIVPEGGMRFPGVPLHPEYPPGLGVVQVRVIPKLPVARAERVAPGGRLPSNL